MKIKELATLMPTIQQYGYLAVMVISTIEGAAIPFPGSILLFGIGFAVSLGQMNIWIGISLGALCYTIASILPYVIGQKLKGRLIIVLERYFKISQGKFATIERAFHQYGEMSVCLTRPFFIGNYISFLAGLAHMEMGKYLLLTFIGTFPWITLHMGLGYFFQGNYNTALVFVKKYNFIFLVGGLLWAGVFILWRIKGPEIRKNTEKIPKKFWRGK